jgi:hypothetical protein
MDKYKYIIVTFVKCVNGAVIMWEKCPFLRDALGMKQYGW